MTINKNDDKKRPKGRPHLPEGTSRGSLVSLRLTLDERATYQAQADQEGLSLSDWIRKTLKNRPK